MSEIKELLADTAIGTSVESTYILAGHPDEYLVPNGVQLSPSRRTMVLKLNDRSTTYVETLQAPLLRAWTSSNKTGYCVPYIGDYIFKFSAGEWRKEIFSQQPMKILFIWGFSGGTPDDDIVYLCTDGAIYIRKKGGWSEHVTPLEIKNIYHVHGLSPDEVYFCSDIVLLLWNGKKLITVEGPAGNNPKSLCVYDRDHIIAGAKYLDIWSETSGWTRVETIYKNFRMLLKIKDEVFAGTSKSGVIRVYPGVPTHVTDVFNCISLWPVGDGLIAIGKNCSYLYNGKSWTHLKLPKCRAGEDLS